MEQKVLSLIQVISSGGDKAGELEIIVCMNVLPVCAYVYHACACCLQRPEGVRFPGIGVTGDCEQTCGCWELNSVLCKSSKCSSLPL